MCPNRCRRCWAAWALAALAGFSVLEQRGLTRKCHPTLSREIAALGPAVVWSFPFIGAAITWHLTHLDEE